MQKLFEVSWIASIPEDEFGDADIDNAEYRYRRFPSLALAKAFAEKVIIGLPFEVAYIQEVREVSLAEIAHSDDLGDYWREGGHWFTDVGERVEVAT